MDFTAYTKEQLVKWLVSGQDMPASHGTVYVGLYTGNSIDFDEVSAADYSRLAVSTSSWDTDVNLGKFENNTLLDFGQAQNDWGTIESFALLDDTQANNGNALAFSSVASPVTVDTGDYAVFRKGNLKGEFN